MFGFSSLSSTPLGDDKTVPAGSPSSSIPVRIKPTGIPKTIGRDFGDVARKTYAVASGALGNGNTCVVNSDGTVSVIGGGVSLTSENFIGITPSAYPTGAGAEIQTKGAVNEQQSGLTAGQSYYVQTDGTLGTSADNPSVFAGTAVSATKIIVKG